MIHLRRHGRHLGDFSPGDVYQHSWEVTVDEGMLGFFAASFQDATPTYSSKTRAKQLGLPDRPVHPLMLLNLGLSFSVQDVSERAIANLSYEVVRFPEICRVGDTLRAVTEVLNVKPVSSGDKGVVHVRTQVLNQEDALVCSFERKALVPAGNILPIPAEERSPAKAKLVSDPVPRAPSALLRPFPTRSIPRGGLTWDDFAPSDIYAHEFGRTVSETEAMQLTTLFRNSHPLHLDQHYCATGSFAKTRVIYGGLVLAWVFSLSSRDMTANGVWELGIEDGAHTSGVVSGDTLFAATQVIAKEELNETCGSVTLRTVGTRNVPGHVLLERGADLFTKELGKVANKVPEKVFEATRNVLVLRKGANA